MFNLDKLTNQDNNNFIHFENTELLNQFQTWYRGSIGHTCCNGLGCLLINVKDSSIVDSIKETFLNHICKN